MKETVSVIIPTYNRGITLVRAVQSVLDQTYSNVEIIIVDDGSTDDTERIISNLGDSRIEYKKLDIRNGVASARNVGLTMATGEYIAFQDSDDVWHDEKIAKQVEYIKKTGYDLVFCPYNRFFMDGQVKLVPNAEIYPYNSMEKNIQTILQKGNVIGTPTILMGRHVMEDIGGFDENMPKLEDYEYVIRVAKKFKIGFTPEPLVDAYFQKDSITYCMEKEWDAYAVLLQNHKEFLDVEDFLIQLLGANLLFSPNGFNKGRMELFSKIMGGNAYDMALDYLASNLLMYKSLIEKGFVFNEKTLTDKGFYIYGAGKKGRDLYWRLKEKELSPICFVVTDQTAISEPIDGIEVKNLNSIQENNPKIIVAVSLKLVPEFVNNLLERGFTDYCIYPY